MIRILCFIFVVSLPYVGLCDDIKHTVLKGQKAKSIAGQCSRENPPAFTDIWVPEEKTIAYLEANLKKIERLSSNLCCLQNERISDVHKYYRQYIGLFLKATGLFI